MQIFYCDLFSIVHGRPRTMPPSKLNKSSILHAPARKTVGLNVVVAEYLRVEIGQAPVPCVSRGTLGSRPEERAVGQIVETTPAGPVAAGKSRKPTAVRRSGVRA